MLNKVIIRAMEQKSKKNVQSRGRIERSSFNQDDDTRRTSEKETEYSSNFDDGAPIILTARLMVKQYIGIFYEKWYLLMK